jgi:hypothetical protein
MKQREKKEMRKESASTAYSPILTLFLHYHKRKNGDYDVSVHFRTIPLVRFKYDTSE